MVESHPKPTHVVLSFETLVVSVAEEARTVAGDGGLCREEHVCHPVSPARAGVPVSSVGLWLKNCLLSCVAHGALAPAVRVSAPHCPLLPCGRSSPRRTAAAARAPDLLPNSSPRSPTFVPSACELAVHPQGGQETGALGLERPLPQPALPCPAPYPPSGRGLSRGPARAVRSGALTSAGKRARCSPSGGIGTSGSFQLARGNRESVPFLRSGSSVPPAWHAGSRSPPAQGKAGPVVWRVASC